jgi:hypothetical protein
MSESWNAKRTYLVFGCVARHSLAPLVSLAAGTFLSNKHRYGKVFVRLVDYMSDDAAGTP